MHQPVRVQLLPSGKTLVVERGTPLFDVLFAEGVEFPCGGRGRCKGCKIKVESGTLPIAPEDEQRFTPTELAQGWRLACRAIAVSDITIALAQWEMPVLADEAALEFTPKDGYGIAIDLGTTTVAAQLLDLRTAKVLAVRTDLNAQVRHGADVMSRVEFACASGAAELTQLIRAQLGTMTRELVESGGISGHVKDVVIVGNTVMHHLFCGLDVAPLASYPFESAATGLQTFRASGLGWELPGDPIVTFLPCLGGFVGSDILAGILAVGMHNSDAPVALIDLGTNGEVVVGNRHKIVCASAAAGPAFEGARIAWGMRAATGAIAEVHLEQGKVRCHVLGNVAPRGICGSGLVDAVACGLELGLIKPDGRLQSAERWELCPPVYLTQSDIRQLQLAKAAIAVGQLIVAEHWGTAPGQLERVYLAGAFGNYVRRSSSVRIGLIKSDPDKIVPAGNTALRGAKLALLGPPDQDWSFSWLRARTTHIALSQHPQFQELFAREMSFGPISS
ncbi:MAG: ASKHA domain-containing protein [Verrucomicrobiae bacterium]|nr:ASKHA domain-containing protein [Verrucomicrobiae bacterium]